MHRSEQELTEGLAEVENSPSEMGRLEAIVTRPVADQRVVSETGNLSPERGLHGDNWEHGCWLKLPDGSPHPDVQIAMMNSRFAKLVAGDHREQWALAGDQLYVDFDLSVDNLRPGNRIKIGAATLQITAEAHTGCAKFAQRFGKEALAITCTDTGKHLRLRGIYAKIIAAGEIAAGDSVVKLSG